MVTAPVDEVERLRRGCLEVIELLNRQADQPVECVEEEDWEVGVPGAPIPTWDPPVEEEPEDDEDPERYDEDGNPMRWSEDESGAGGGW